MMGVPWEDCTIVAELIGIKTVLNEFVAYTDLATYIANRHNGTKPHISVCKIQVSRYCILKHFLNSTKC